MQNDEQYSRRVFLKQLAATSAFATTALPAVSASRVHKLRRRRPPRPVSANDRIRLATIGTGIIGFIDTRTALQVPGVELVAAADLYDGRLVHVKEVFGNEVFTTRDYREVLARSDVDAVIISTPDHWHAKITIAALNAGKHVYCEKPMVQKLEDGYRVIEAQRKTKKLLQVGSQYASSLIYEKAKELFESGAIGELNLVQVSYNRNSAIGAWQYSIPPDASPETIDWDRFLGDAPKRPFDPIRFFRWRNYRDYGTGIPGDLYVHLFTGIHLVLSSKGPVQVLSTGGLRYWQDGRDVPDVMLGLYDYPATDTHPGFTLSLTTNFADGGGGGSSFRFIGNEGVMTIEHGGVTVTRRAPQPPTEKEIVEGYNSVFTFSEAMQKKFVEEYRASHAGKPARPQLDSSSEYKAPESYDDRFDHFTNFFEAIRHGRPVLEDAVYGFRAAAPSLLTNKSYLDRRVYEWDPVKMKVAS